MKKLYVFISILYFTNAYSQCAIKAIAEPSGDTLHCSSNFGYELTVTYNPNFQLYYSVNSGGSDPDEFFDLNGTQLGNSTTIDWRGIWFNPNTNFIEGNVWGNSLVWDSLNSNGFYGIHFTYAYGLTPPNEQAIGVYSATDNKIYYHNNGKVFSQERTFGSTLDTINLVNSPVTVTDLVDMTMIYTGCTGKELGLFDKTNTRLLFFDKVTGNYAGSIDFPSNTPALNVSIYGGKFAFANNLFWLHHESEAKWVGYTIFESAADLKEKLDLSVEMYPNPAATELTIKVNRPTNFEVVSVYGQSLTSFQIIDNAKLDVSNFAKGLYFLVSKDGITRQFMVQ